MHFDNKIDFNFTPHLKQNICKGESQEYKHSIYHIHPCIVELGASSHPIIVAPSFFDLAKKLI
jgi:hypothetical protein